MWDDIIEAIRGYKKDGWTNFGKRPLTEYEEGYNKGLQDAIHVIRQNV